MPALRRRHTASNALVGLGRRGRRFVCSAPRTRLSGFLVKSAFVLHAVTLLIVIEVGLRRGTLDVLCGRLGIRLRHHAAPLGEQWPRSSVPWAELHRVAARGIRVLRWWPFESTCLRRCLLWGAVLRDHEPELLVGVRRNDTGEIAAHSWLVLGGHSVDPESRSFASFATS